MRKGRRGAEEDLCGSNLHYSLVLYLFSLAKLLEKSF